MYSILDIETTGNHAAIHRITEIAILNYDGEKVTERYCTLVRPDTDIPFFISRLTGITNEMVKQAPSFDVIAQELDDFTRNRILVAHNAHFDYTFLKQAFQRHGYSFQRKTLCTLRLSRKIFPGLRSYALDNLCRTLAIAAKPVHRAESDAVAAMELFRYLQNNDHAGVIEGIQKKKTAEFNLPPNLRKEAVLQLPEAAGVYYFIDNYGKILYIGKAKNLKQRVQSHFSGISPTRSSTALMNRIHQVNYQLCGNELIAMLLESAEIKKYFPPFNAAQKLSAGNYGIYCYEDGKGYKRLGIKKINTSDHPLASFPSLERARSYLSAKKRDHKLCAKLCGLQRAPYECHDHVAGLCDGACCGKVTAVVYNARVDEALQATRTESRSFILTGEGRTAGECSVVVLEDGRYLGFGFLQSDHHSIDFTMAKEAITYYKDNREVQSIIHGWLSKNPDYRLIETGNSAEDG